jgi:Amt family ammonium transporter
MIQWHPAFDSGDLTWVLLNAAAVLVLLGPGLALFYAGLSGTVRLTELAPRYLAAVILLTLVWGLWAYSLGFAPGLGTVPSAEADAPVATDLMTMMEADHNLKDTGEQQGRGGWIGGADYVNLRSLMPRAGFPHALFPSRRPAYRLPHAAFMVLHMMVFVSAAAPLVVALGDRLSWIATMLFLALWGTIVYAPLAHWVWGEGWLSELGALDSAGGLWHVGIGCSAWMCALLTTSTPATNDHEAPLQSNPTLVAAGTVLAWAGMLAMHGGLALKVDGRAAVSLLNSHLAAAAGVIGWQLAARVMRGPVGMPTWCAGAVAGLAAIAPGCRLMVAESALIVGLTSGAMGAAIWHGLRSRSRGQIGPAAFAVQGVAGGVGMVLAGVFTSSSMAGLDRHGQAIEGLVGGQPARVGIQALAVGAVAALAVAGTWLGLTLARIRARPAPWSATTQDDNVQETIG